MKAILQPAYGLPEVLHLAEVDRPVLHDDGVLVRVLAASVNKADWHYLTGAPYLFRLSGVGFKRPNKPIPGMAVAGRVVAVGVNVHAFQVGDEVFGEIDRGGFAEYVCVSEQELAHKPADLAFEESAALPLAGTTALQGLRDAGRLQPGQSVLINGAAGGVGTFAVQIAKALGAVVTGVCSTRNVELVRSIGADHVVDYNQEDFTRGDRRYDVIFDLVGNQSLSACRRVLTEHGRLVSSSGGAEHAWVGPMVFVLSGIASNLYSRQPFVAFAAKASKDDLIALRGLVEAGQVRPVIDRHYKLSEVPEAMRYLGQGRSRGKCVVTL
ncbi:MAG: NAD(P)-dependent alcohol dehydrogenase [Pseudomonadota bacterium]|nr:NAD(P)-dependent alcohol dehydrogenase [Pseudomonadota bacterium]